MAHLYNFTHEKAGMGAVNKEHVQSVVHDMSKDSDYHRNALKHGARTAEQVREITQKLQAANAGQRASAEKAVASATAALEASRDFTRVCAVVDLDMFFAAVEMRDDPSLRDKPMAVGGMGMISTANYAARKFGVRSAMPGFIAVKLCPNLVFVKPNYQKYVDVAKDVRAVFVKYDPAFRAASLDEAYLDLTDCLVQRGVLPQPPALPTPDGPSPSTSAGHSAGPSTAAAPSAPKCTSMIKGFHPPAVDTPAPRSAADLPVLRDEQEQPADAGRAHQAHISAPDAAQAAIEAVVAEMRAEIMAVTQITASAGIGPNPMLAKIASDFNKPNGQYFVPFNRKGVISFVGALPVRKIPFVGKVSEALLGQAFGVTNGAQLLTKLPDIYMTLSENQRTFLHRSCLGIADTSREEGESHRRKSVSQERTFRDCSDAETLRSKCQEISAKVSGMMQKGDPARGTSWEFFGSSDEGALGWQDTAARAEHLDRQDAEHSDNPSDCTEDSTAPGEDGIPRVPYRGKTVTLKLKLSNFKVLSRQTQLPRLTNSADVIAAAAIELLDKELEAAAPGSRANSAAAGAARTAHCDTRVATTAQSSSAPCSSSASSKLTLRLMGVRMSALVFDDEIENSPLVQFLQGAAQSEADAAAKTCTSSDCNADGHAAQTRYDSLASFGAASRPRRGRMEAFLVPAHILAQGRGAAAAKRTGSASASGVSDEVIDLGDEADSQETVPKTAGPAHISGKQSPPPAPGRGKRQRQQDQVDTSVDETCINGSRTDSKRPMMQHSADADVLDLTMSPPLHPPMTHGQKAAASQSTLGGEKLRPRLPCPVGIAPAAWAALPESIQRELASAAPKAAKKRRGARSTPR